jgi:hypothetical protein
VEHVARMGEMRNIFHTYTGGPRRNNGTRGQKGDTCYTKRKLSMVVQLTPVSLSKILVRKSES